jgi:phosphoglycolate phosphatase
MLPLKKYRHLIWDWNGTLLDDAWLCVEVMNGMLKERGLPSRTLDQYREIFDFPVRDYYIKLGFDFGKEPFEVVGMEFMVRYNKRQHETALHPEVRSVLEFFRAQGIKQFILSAREEKELVQEISNLCVLPYFSGIFGLDDHYAHGKTDVGIRLLRETGVDPGEVVFIGDTRHDAEVAGEIGVDCILIPNGHHSEERLGRLGVPVVASLEDLRSLSFESQ